MIKTTNAPKCGYLESGATEHMTSKKTWFLWLKEESFQEAVKHYWMGMTNVHTLSDKENFILKLTSLKKYVVKWVRLKVKEQSLELIKVEAEIAALLESAHTISFNTPDKDRLLFLQQRKDHLLLLEEITWRLKSWAL